MSELIKIHNVETGEIIERPMDDDEIQKLTKAREEFIERQEIKAEAAAKRTAALAKLEALGLDEDDLKALGL
jgi:hypothetical protein